MRRLGAGDRVRSPSATPASGIAAGISDRLFTPFDRLGAEQTGVEGTGLGLALLARAGARLMGGTIDVESAARARAPRSP